jgi:hypothetical protein
MDFIIGWLFSVFARLNARIAVNNLSSQTTTRRMEFSGRIRVNQ